MSSAADQPSGPVRSPQGTSAGPADQRPAEYAPYDTYDTGSGWVYLAGWLLILGGLWSLFAGLAVVIRKSYFTSLPGYSSAAHSYAYHWNLSGWGWANLILGIVVVAAGVCILLGQTWARWAGIILAVISGLGQFLFLPFYPFWSILVIAVDVLIVWALCAAWRRQPA